MDEEILINNLTIGIWTLEEDGITFRISETTEGFIPNNLISYREILDDAEVWERIIHLAGKVWMNEKHLEHLMMAFSIKRRHLDIQFDENDLEELDLNTVEKSFEIINDVDVDDDLGWMDVM